MENLEWKKLVYSLFLCSAEKNFMYEEKVAGTWSAGNYEYLSLVVSLHECP